MFDDYEGDILRGISSELFINELSESGIGYVLEVTMDNTAKSIEVDRHYLNDIGGPLEGRVSSSDIDYLENNLKGSDFEGINLLEDHCADITVGDNTLTVYADNKHFIAMKDGEVLNDLNNPDQVSDIINDFIYSNYD